MFKQIKGFFELKEKNQSLEKKIKMKQARIDDLEFERLHRSAPQIVVENILKRKIKWVDASKMSIDQSIAWYNEAQALLKNKVFISLAGGTDKDGSITNGELVKELIEEVARSAQDWEQVRDIRVSINAIEMIRNKVEAIQDPRDNQTKNNIYSAI